MSIKIYLLNIKECLNNPVDEYLKYFSAQRVEKILRYKFNSDRNRTVWAELLARKLISDRTGKNINEIKIFRASNGRPYCEEKEIFFSLSHSGEWVACSIGNFINGVDIEKLDRKIDVNIAKNFFLENEYEKIKNLNEDEQIKKFFEYWTLKESCLKCFNLREWSGVDCEKLLNGNSEREGRNFYLKNSILGVCTEKGNLPGNFIVYNSPAFLFSEKFI